MAYSEYVLRMCTYSHDLVFLEMYYLYWTYEYTFYDKIADPLKEEKSLRKRVQRATHHGRHLSDSRRLVHSDNRDG